MIELGAGGGFPIWPQSDDVDFARESVVVIITFLIVALGALLLSLFLPIEEVHMPKLPSKTAETPANELPFPGKLVEGKYDVLVLVGRCFARHVRVLQGVFFCLFNLF
jgi:hypothetical protein